MREAINTGWRQIPLGTCPKKLVEARVHPPAKEALARVGIVAKDVGGILKGRCNAGPAPVKAAR